MAKILQLYRNTSEVFTSFTTAKAQLENVTFLGARKDGEIVLARYTDGNNVKSALGLYHKGVDGKNGVTVLKDIEAIDTQISTLQSELDTTQTSAGLNTDGTYTAPTDDSIIGETTSLKDADVNLANKIRDILSTIDSLDFSKTLGDSEVFATLTQTNGQLSSTERNLSTVKLAGYTVGGDNSGKVAAADTLGEALGKLQGQINGMDKSANVVNGQVVTTVEETDGKVSETKANVKDLQLGGYSKDNNATGAIGGTDTVNTALSKIENTIAANTVSSTDKTITIDTTGATTDLAVNIDGTTLVKNSSTGVISSGLKIKSITQASGSTYASQYQLVYGNSETPIGDTISVAKDQFLKSASYDSSTQILTLVMYTADGSESNITVDFSDAVIEAEAGDGLYVGTGDEEGGNGKAVGSLNVGIDANSESVTISDNNGGSTTAAVLSVSADAIKVSNIQNAINYAISSLSVETQGDDYITATIDNNNNKKINISADVQNMTATAGTVGVYDSTGAQTTAPVAGTLTGVTNSLVDGADVASKVKTFVDGAIAIEKARSNANTLASIQALDFTDTVVSGQFVTEVNETNGIISVSRANVGTAVIAGFEQSSTTTGDIAATDTLSAALNKLENKADNSLDSVVGSDAITVTTKSNKSQTISLKLDATSQSAVSSAPDNVLTITSGEGLYLSSVWDCGSY